MTEKEIFEKRLKQLTIGVGLCFIIISVLFVLSFWSVYELT